MIPRVSSVPPRPCGDNEGSGGPVRWSHTLYGGWENVDTDEARGCGETAYCISADAYEVVWQCPDCGWAYAVANPNIP